jgi:uncharacterized protein YdeI (YjbR/CyaY-like superfamily)
LLFRFNFGTKWYIQFRNREANKQWNESSGMLNSIPWSSSILGKTKTIIYKSIVESIMLYGSETWTLNRRQQNKLLATEMDYWKRSTRKSRRERIRNTVIREIMEVEKTILERIETFTMVWACEKNGE